MKIPSSRLFRALALGLLILTMSGTSALAANAKLARQLTDRGIEMQKEGDHDKALALFDAALVELDHPKIRYFKAKSLRALERLDEALAEFDGIKDEPAVGKYREEILAFISDIKGAHERLVLAERLASEREARAALERERSLLEGHTETSAIERIKQKRTPLHPPVDDRAVATGPTARIVPLIPTFHEPIAEYGGVMDARQHLEAIDDYETELTLGKAFTVAAVIGVSMGVGLAANPLGDGDPSDGARQAGLAVGIAGLMSGLVALVIWPDELEDPRQPTAPSHGIGAPGQAAAATP